MTYREQVLLSEETFNFYSKIAQAAGLELEKVLSDALFRLAGELSLEAIGESKRRTLQEELSQES